MEFLKNLEKQYLMNENKYILPEDKGESNQDLAATVAANFASMTFRMSAEDVDRLSHASREDIIEFYQYYYPILSSWIGANHEYHPFYPNFPQEVMEKSELEMFFDQVLYAFSGLQIRPEVYEEVVVRFPYMGYTSTHNISAGSLRECSESINKLMLSQVAYTPMQRDYMRAFFQDYSKLPKEAQKLPDFTKLKNHENRVVLACIMSETGFDEKQIRPLLSDVNDIIKYASIRSAQRDYEKKKGNIAEIINADNRDYSADDFYHYANLSYQRASGKVLAPSFKLSRADRKLVVSALETNAKRYKSNEHSLAEQMMNNKIEWKKLIHNVRISDYPWATETAKAFAEISTNKPISRSSRTIEEAIKANDLKSALEAAAAVPGDFVRRTDKFLRMAKTSEEMQAVKDTLAEVSSKASVASLMALTAHIKNREEQKKNRIFKIPASGKTFSKEDTRAPFSRFLTSDIKQICVEGISKQMEGKAIFTEKNAKVFISPQTKGYKVPTDVRDLSKGTHTYTRGSRVDVSTPSDYRRFFVWWTDTKSQRVDIDLSVSMYDKDGNWVMSCSWNTAKKIPGTDKYAVVFSGDVQEGGPIDGKGVAEFMDVDAAALREMGVKYILPSVNSYCHQPMYAMENIAFGYMDRDEIVSIGTMGGQPFEPSTVETKFDLNANATSCIPCIFDISCDELMHGRKKLEKGNEGIMMTWVDMPYQGRVMTRDGSIIDRILEMVEGQSLMAVDDLIEINARSNHVPTFCSLEEATTIFATDKEYELYQKLNPEIDFSEKIHIRPDDLNYIMGTLLATAKDMPREDVKTYERDAVSELFEDIPGTKPTGRDEEEIER